MSTKTTQKNIKFTPAGYLLQFFDSKQAVANFFGVTRSAISKWNRPEEYQGTNGRIPAKHWPTIISKGWMTIDQLNSESFEAAALSNS